MPFGSRALQCADLGQRLIEVVFTELRESQRQRGPQSRRRLPLAHGQKRDGAHIAPGGPGRVGELLAQRRKPGRECFVGGWRVRSRG